MLRVLVLLAAVLGGGQARPNDLQVPAEDLGALEHVQVEPQVLATGQKLVNDRDNLVLNESRVNYDGAQLWKVVVDNNPKRALVWQLKEDNSKLIDFFILYSIISSRLRASTINDE